MLLKENLQKNRIFADDYSEEQFRASLSREVALCRQFEGGIREVVLTDSGPDSVAAVLSCLLTEVPALLASSSWGKWTWDAYAQVKDSRVGKGSVLIRTGGSSGKPKFAIHNWETLQASAENLWSHLGRRPLSAILDLPLNHVSGWMPVMRALVSGGSVLEPGAGEFEQLPGMRLFSVVPTTLYRALANPKKKRILQQADRVFAGGAAFSPELLEEGRRANLALSLVYGMTETAAMVAVQDPDDFAAGREPRVSAIGGNQIEIGDQNEIRIRSSQLFAGYLGQARREGAFWPTGDLGALDEEGRLDLWGRKGRFVSSGGETVSLEKIEEAAKRLPGVADAYAAANQDPEWGERVHLFLVSEESAQVDWRKELKSILDPHEIPASVKELKEIPRNGAGKVDPDRLFG